MKEGGRSERYEKKEERATSDAESLTGLMTWTEKEQSRDCLTGLWDIYLCNRSKHVCAGQASETKGDKKKMQSCPSISIPGRARRAAIAGGAPPGFSLGGFSLKC